MKIGQPGSEESTSCLPMFLYCFILSSLISSALQLIVFVLFVRDITHLIRQLKMLRQLYRIKITRSSNWNGRTSASGKRRDEKAGPRKTWLGKTVHCNRKITFPTQMCDHYVQKFNPQQQELNSLSSMIEKIIPPDRVPYNYSRIKQME